MLVANTGFYVWLHFFQSMDNDVRDYHSVTNSRFLCLDNKTQQLKWDLPENIAVVMDSTSYLKTRAANETGEPYRGQGHSVFTPPPPTYHCELNTAEEITGTLWPGLSCHKSMLHSLILTHRKWFAFKLVS